MRKISVYARKRAMQSRVQEHENLARLIMQDLRNLQIDAGIHAWTGADGQRMCNLAGRLCFIAAGAGTAAGIHEDHPDMRILRGMANALGELASDTSAVDAHRASLQSGLAAVDRVLEQCGVVDIAMASLDLTGRLATPQGIGTDDIFGLMGVEA